MDLQSGGGAAVRGCGAGAGLLGGCRRATAAEPDALRMMGLEVEGSLVAAGGIFWYSLNVCQSAGAASIAGVCTTGYPRCARGVEIEVRTARFVLQNISREESVDSAVIQTANVASTYR